MTLEQFVLCCSLTTYTDRVLGDAPAPQRTSSQPYNCCTLPFKGFIRKEARSANWSCGQKGDASHGMRTAAAATLLAASPRPPPSEPRLNLPHAQLDTLACTCTACTAQRYVHTPKHAHSYTHARLDTQACTRVCVFTAQCTLSAHTHLVRTRPDIRMCFACGTGGCRQRGGVKHPRALRGCGGARQDHQVQHKGRARARDGPVLRLHPRLRDLI